MTSARVLVNVHDNIAWVTICNPARRNALSTAMMESLAGSLHQLDLDAAVRVIVLRGEGTVAFASGADISEFDSQQNSPEAKQRADATTAQLFTRMEHLTTPVVAMIFGLCFGAGMAIATCADIRIGAATSEYAIPAAKLGLGYPVGLTHSLVQLTRPGPAAELLFTGRRFSAGEALQAGFLNRVVPADALEETTIQLVRTIAGNAPLSVRASKAAIQSAYAPDRRQTADAYAGACADSEDVREGQRAFMQKRQPQFQGG